MHIAKCETCSFSLAFKQQQQQKIGCKQLPVEKATERVIQDKPYILKLRIRAIWSVSDNFISIMKVLQWNTKFLGKSM